MPIAAPSTDFGCWSVEGHAPNIEYAVQVLEEICAEAVDGLCRFRHGGAEIGGVLFGEADGATVRILAARPLNCEYAFGPRFVLSERDRASLRELLYAVRSDPELAGMEPVGWYHSHTRSGIELSPRDLEIYDSYFPQRRQVALVLRPDTFGPTVAGFFFREKDKVIRTGSSYREFEIRPRRVRKKATAEPESVGSETAEPKAAEPAESARVAALAPVASVSAEPETLVVPPPSAEVVSVADPDVVIAERPEVPGFVREPASTSWKWAWLFMLAAMVGATALGVERYYRLSAPPQPLSLWVADMGGQLLIEWDRTAQSIRDAEGATLEIMDGKDRADIRIEPDRLREGSVDYVRHAEIVDVRLRVHHRGRPIEEFIRFVGQPVQRPGSTQEAELLRQNEALKTEVANLRAQLESSSPGRPRAAQTAAAGRITRR